MKNAFWVIAIILLFMLQLGIGESFGLAPNLALIYLCVMLVNYRLRVVLAASLVTGSLLDYFSGTPDGVMIVSVLAAVVCSYFFSRLFSQEHLARFVLVFHAAFTAAIFVITFLALTQILFWVGWVASPDWGYSLSRHLPFHVILNVVFLYPIVWVYEFQLIAQNKLLKKHDAV